MTSGARACPYPNQFWRKSLDLPMVGLSYRHFAMESVPDPLCYLHYSLLYKHMWKMQFNHWWSIDISDVPDLERWEVMG